MSTAGVQRKDWPAFAIWAGAGEWSVRAVGRCGPRHDGLMGDVPNPAPAHETEDLLEALDTRAIDGPVRMVDRVEMIRAALEPNGMVRVGMTVEDPAAATPPKPTEERP